MGKAFVRRKGKQEVPRSTLAGTAIGKPLQPQRHKMAREVSQELSDLADIFSDCSGVANACQTRNPSHPPPSEPGLRLLDLASLETEQFYLAVMGVIKIWEHCTSTECKAAERKAVLQVLAQPAHFHFLQQLTASASTFLASADVARLSRINLRAYVTLYGVTTRLTLHVLADPIQPKLPDVAIFSLAVLPEVLLAHVSLLPTARDPDRRQALGPDDEWLSPSFGVVAVLIDILMHLWPASACDAAKPAPCPPCGPWPLQQRLLYTANLVESLASSQLIEQAMRTRFCILTSAEGSPQEKSQHIVHILDVCRRMAMFASRLHFFSQNSKEDAVTTRIIAALHKLMVGPSLNYTAMAYAVAQMALIDGGALYGMDPKHAAALHTDIAALTDHTSSSDEHDDKSGDEDGEEENDIDRLNAFLSPFEHWATYLMMALSDPVASQQLHNSNLSGRVLRHGVRKLSLRLLRAVRRLAAGYEAQRQQQQGRDAGGSSSMEELPAVGALEASTLLPEERLVETAYVALRCLSHHPHRLVVRLLDGTQHLDCETDVRVAEEYWSEVVPTVEMMLTLHGRGQDEHGATASAVGVLASMATPGWPAGDLPPAPPPNLAAALAAGWMPLVVRALCHPLPQHFLDSNGTLWAFKSWSTFGRVLAYGDPQQVEALLITGAEQIRLLGAAGSAVGGPTGASDYPRGGGADPDEEDENEEDKDDEDEEEEALKEAAIDTLFTLPLDRMKEWIQSYAVILNTATARPPPPPGCDGWQLSYKEAAQLGIADFCVPSMRSCNADTKSSTCNNSNISSSGSIPMGGSGPSGSDVPVDSKQPANQGCSEEGQGGAAGAANNSADNTSPGFLHFAQAPSHQMLAMLLRVLQLWLPAINTALTQLAEGSGPDLRVSLLMSWEEVLNWVPSMVAAHAMASGRLPLPDWWTQHGSVAGEQQLHAAAAFWRRLLLEELNVLRMLGRMLTLLHESETELVFFEDDDIADVYDQAWMALAYLAAEFPAEVAAGLHDDAALGRVTPLNMAMARAAGEPWGRCKLTLDGRGCLIGTRLHMLKTAEAAQLVNAHTALTSADELYGSDCQCLEACGMLLDASLRLGASSSATVSMLTCAY